MQDYLDSQNKKEEDEDCEEDDPSTSFGGTDESVDDGDGTRNEDLTTDSTSDDGGVYDCTYCRKRFGTGTTVVFNCHCCGRVACEDCSEELPKDCSVYCSHECMRGAEGDDDGDETTTEDRPEVNNGEGGDDEGKDEGNVFLDTTRDRAKNFEKQSREPPGYAGGFTGHNMTTPPVNGTIRCVFLNLRRLKWDAAGVILQEEMWETMKRWKADVVGLCDHGASIDKYARKGSEEASKSATSGKARSLATRWGGD